MSSGSEAQPVTTAVHATAATPEAAAAAIEAAVGGGVAHIPPALLWRALGRLGLYALALLTYLIVADVSFHEREAQHLLYALGDKVVWVLAGVLVPSPIVALLMARRPMPKKE